MLQASGLPLALHLGTGWLLSVPSHICQEIVLSSFKSMDGIPCNGFSRQGRAKWCVFRKVIVQKITQLSFSLTRKPGMRVYDSLVVVGSQLGAPATKCGCASFRATGALFSALYTRSGVHSHHFVCCDEGPTKKYFYATLMVA